MIRYKTRDVLMVCPGCGREQRVLITVPGDEMVLLCWKCGEELKEDGE